MPTSSALPKGDGTSNGCTPVEPLLTTTIVSTSGRSPGRIRDTSVSPRPARRHELIRSRELSASNSDLDTSFGSDLPRTSSSQTLNEGDGSVSSEKKKSRSKIGITFRKQKVPKQQSEDGMKKPKKTIKNRISTSLGLNRLSSQLKADSRTSLHQLEASRIEREARSSSVDMVETKRRHSCIETPEYRASSLSDSLWIAAPSPDIEELMLEPPTRSFPLAEAPLPSQCHGDVLSTAMALTTLRGDGLDFLTKARTVVDRYKSSVSVTAKVEGNETKWQHVPGAR